MAFGDQHLAQVRARQSAMMKRAFLQQNAFTVANWKAPTKIGCFDGRYDAGAHTYTITIKVFYEWDNSGAQWTQQAKTDYKNGTARVVHDHWSYQYTITCAKPGWEDIYADVVVNVVEVNQANQAHVKLVAKRIPDGGRSQGGGVSWTSTPAVADVDSLGLMPKYTKGVYNQIFNMREKMMRDKLKGLDLEYIPFGNGVKTPPHSALIKLAQYATYLNRVVADDVAGIKVLIHGSTNSTDSGIHVGLGKTRANAILQILQQRCNTHRDIFERVTNNNHNPAVLEVLKRKLRPNKTRARHNGVVMMVHTPPNVTREAQTNYIVMVHEFGHVLGLPDEYRGRLHPNLTPQINLNTIIPATMSRAVTNQNPDQRLAKQQRGMARMLNGQTHVASPFFLAGEGSGETLAQDIQDYDQAKNDYYDERDRVRGQYGAQSRQYARWKDEHQPPPPPPSYGSSSIMYGGMDIQPAHYLTIWSSLAEATSRYLAPNEWKIVPSQRNVKNARFFS